MHEQDLAIVKGLVSVAWADGKVMDEELQVIDALLEAFQATPSEIHEVRMYARQPRTIDDIPLTDLSADDRRVLLHHAVLLTFSDGHQAESERQLIGELARRLGILPEQAERIAASAEAHARTLHSKLGDASGG